jgi:broad specificity phosphatase PhoE
MQRMASCTRIHFIRHGDVENPKDIFYGRLPGFGLSEEGRRQAQAAAEALRDAPIRAIFSSPLLRATETADIIAASRDDLRVELSDLLLEVHVPFDGQHISEVIKRQWDVFAGNEPPYEQPADVLRRALQFIAEVRQNYLGQEVVAVTHGDVLVFLLSWANGAPITSAQRLAMYREGYALKASVTTLIYQTASEDEVPTTKYMIPYEP